MLDPNIILRGQQVENPFESAAQGIQFGQGLRQLLSGRQAGKMQQIASPEERQAFANKSMFSRELNAQIKADALAQEQKALALQKHNADIGKTNSEAFKNNQQGGGYRLDNSQKQLGAIQGAIQQAAMTGDKTAAIIGLDAANRVGLISPEDYSHQYKLLTAMTPEEVKSYAQSVTFANAKDPASLVYTSADNVLDNETSIQNNILTNQTSADNNIRTNQTAENNNIRTTDTNRYSTDVAANTAQQKLSFDQARLEFEQKKGIVQQFGDNMYMVYPDGSAVPISSPTGVVSKTTTSPAIKQAQQEEGIRTQRVDAVLPEIKSLLSKATGSYIGTGVDFLANTVGVSTEGAKATAQLKTLSGQLVALMPKMSGPQSDKDVAMYKEMAGNLSDPTIPVDQRMAALETIEKLNEKYKQLNGGGIPTTITKPSTSRPPVTSFFQ